MLTRWSDGSETVAEMVDAAVERSYEDIAITDHSKGRLDLTDEADLARALALSDTPATKIPDKGRHQPRSSSKQGARRRRQSPD